MIQLDFFQELDDYDYRDEEIKRIKLSTDKVRKSLFAKHGELAKLYVELDHRMNILERNICKKG